MAVISDIGGTSQNSFSINGKITLFQGDGIPDDLMGNNGDVYFKSEGLIYVKRNGTWLTNDPEDIKWIPDPRLHRNTLLYSNGENYEHTKITYNDNPNDPYQLELFQTPNGSSLTTSMIVPNLGLLNDPSKDTNILHKSGNETKVDILSLKNKNGLRGNNNISSHQLNFLDKNNNTTGSLKNILNTSNESSVENNTVITQLLAKSSNNESKINLIAKSDGTKYATAPTPSANASENEIVTAEWALSNILSVAFNKIYPIGCVYLTLGQNPATILGFGTWQKIENAKGRVLQVSDNSHSANTTIPPGLPNITGKTKSSYGINNTTPNTGALITEIYPHGAADGRQDGGDSGDGELIQSSTIEFKASSSNSIYGSSTTVQPPAFVVDLWQRIR